MAWARTGKAHAICRWLLLLLSGFASAWSLAAALRRDATRRWLIHSAARSMRPKADNACTVDKKHSNRTFAARAGCDDPQNDDEEDESEDAINDCDFHSDPYPHSYPYPYPFAVLISPVGHLVNALQLESFGRDFLDPRSFHFASGDRPHSARGEPVQCALKRFAEVLSNTPPAQPALTQPPSSIPCCIHVIAILPA